MRRVEHDRRARRGTARSRIAEEQQQQDVARPSRTARAAGPSGRSPSRIGANLNAAAARLVDASTRLLLARPVRPRSRRATVSSSRSGPAPSCLAARCGAPAREHAHLLLEREELRRRRAGAPAPFSSCLKSCCSRSPVNSSSISTDALSWRSFVLDALFHPGERLERATSPTATTSSRRCASAPGRGAGGRGAGSSCASPPRSCRSGRGASS